MTSDDCLWISELDGKKLNEGLFIVEVLPGGVADKAGIKNSDVLIAINGTKFKTINEAQDILNDFENDETVEYTIIRDNQILNLNLRVIKFFNLLVLIFSLLGFGFLIIGFLVGYSKPKEFTSQLFYMLGCSASLLFTQIGRVTTYYEVLTYFNIVFGSLFYCFFVHFSITYPIKIDFKYRKVLLIIFYSVLMSVVFLRMITYDSDFRTVLSRIGFIGAIISISLGIHFFIRSYFRLQDKNLRKPLKAIMFGFILGGIGLLYSLFISLFMKTPNFLVEPLIFLPVALVLFIPISIGFSIFKYRILDTEFIVERYNYRKSLLEFSEDLPYLDNIRQIIEKIGTSVKDTMGIAHLNVWFKDDEYDKILQNEYQLDEVNGSSPFRHDKLIHKHTDFDEAFSSLFVNSKEPKILNALYLQELKIPEEYKEIIKKENFALIIPIFIKDNLIGTMNFGNKPSGKSYSEEDIDLLKTLASQAAIAFENSRLQKEKLSKQMIEEELHIARRIQMGLLPQSINSIDGIEVSGFYNPAKIIGCDFYDVIKLSENKMLVIVADVSGKGIPAALYMSKVQAMIQFAASIFHSPKDILIEVNKQIHNKIDKKSFITTIVALFDLEKMTVKICRAGHNPVIYSVNGKLHLLKNKGMGLGLESAKYFDDNLEETEIDISNDNVFVFYSDGLTEAMNKNREEFGTDKIMDIIDINRQQSCSLIQKEIINSVDTFRGSAEQNDDITLVITKIKSKQQIPDPSA
ncbi:MAG: SpoIIE family protein phosphatase [Ignavibacteria bacterium]|nr:SpoIIE family protein phosphatase [Ignavibacteria bacterium]